MKKRFAITAFGFLITPLIAAALLVTVEVIAGSLELLHQALAWMFILYFYAFMVTVIIALPTFFVLSRVNKVSWWWGLITGLFCGALPVVFWGVTVTAIPVGGISGLLFWLIWRWGGDSDGNDDIRTVVSGFE